MAIFGLFCVSCGVNAQKRFRRLANVTGDNNATIGAANTDACADDHKRFCGMSVGVSLDVCMKRNYQKLSKTCIDAEYKHFKAESTDERSNNPALKKACGRDITRHCTNYKGDIIACLEQKSSLLASDCSKMVNLERRTRRIDLRLNPALQSQCRADIAANCANIPKGRGAVFACLKAASRKVNVVLSSDCQKAISKDNLSAAQNALSLPGISNNCKSDLSKYCKDVRPGGGRTHACLRKNLAKLSDNCKKSEFEQLLDEANDIRINKNLSSACAGDLRDTCKMPISSSEIVPDHGKAIACLKENMRTLAPECKEQVLIKLKEQSSDIRLKTNLFRTCHPAIVMLCKGIPPGEGVLKCLHRQLGNPLLGMPCKKALATDTKVASLFALADKDIAKFCMKDLEKFCGFGKAIKDFSGKILMRGEGRENLCLLQNMKQLSVGCRNAKVEELIREAKDYAAKPQLVRFCRVDVEKFCLRSTEDGGDDGKSGEILSCLRNHLRELSPPCKRAEFKELELEGGNIKLKAKVYRACKQDLASLCPGVSDEEALRCLKDKTSDKKMTTACRAQLIVEKRVAALTISATPAVSKACDKDLKTLCATVKPGEGRTHACLRKNIDKLSAPCKEAEFKEMIDESEDIVAQPWLSKACEAPLKSLCKISLPTSLKAGVSAASGALLNADNGKAKDCLKMHYQVDRPMLGEECKIAVEEQIKLESRDIRLDAKLYKNCKPAIEQLCSAVPKTHDGKIRICLFAALVDTPNKIDLRCRGSLRKAMVDQSSDWKRNYQVWKNCKMYVKEHCAKVATENPAVVVNCLADNVEKLKDGKMCKRLIFNAMKYQLQDARTNMAISKNCKDDVQRFCRGVKPGGGRTRSCLRKNADQLEKKCRDAEFKTQKYYEEVSKVSGIKVNGGDPDTAAKAKAVLNQMSAALQKAQKPASTGTVDDGNANASSSLVLKGPMAMLALSALCLLVVLAIMHFYQKFQKNSKGYTVVVNKAG